MTAKGEEVARYRIRVKGQVRWMYTDTYVVTLDELVEAKSNASRSSVREAIGQLFDYRRLLPSPPQRQAILLPNKPVDDLIELITSLGFFCIWEEERGEFHRAAPALT